MQHDDLPEDALCALCYDVRCHPTRLASCDHEFCRLCVFKCLDRCMAGSRFASSQTVSCPMCRTACLEEVIDVLMPSDLEYNAQAAAELSRAHPESYQAALQREALVEEKLRETLIPSLPLVQLPGSCRGPRGGSLRPNLSRRSVKLYFRDNDAQKALLSQERVGVLFNDVSHHNGSSPRGFLARPVRRKFTTGTDPQTGQRTLCAHLSIEGDFEVVGRVKRVEVGGTSFLYGAVEQLAESDGVAQPRRNHLKWTLSALVQAVMRRAVYSSALAHARPP